MFVSSTYGDMCSAGAHLLLQKWPSMYVLCISVPMLPIPEHSESINRNSNLSQTQALEASSLCTSMLQYHCHDGQLCLENCLQTEQAFIVENPIFVAPNPSNVSKSTTYTVGISKETSIENTSQHMSSCLTPGYVHRALSPNKYVHSNEIKIVQNIRGVVV